MERGKLGGRRGQGARPTPEAPRVWRDGPVPVLIRRCLCLRDRYWLVVSSGRALVRNFSHPYLCPYLCLSSLIFASRGGIVAYLRLSLSLSSLIFAYLCFERRDSCLSSLIFASRGGIVAYLCLSSSLSSLIFIFISLIQKSETARPELTAYNQAFTAARRFDFKDVALYTL